MTLHELCQHPVGMYAALFYTLIFIGQLYNTAMAFTLGVPPRRSILYAILLAAELAFAVILFDAAYHGNSAFLAITAATPATALAAVEATLTPVTVCAALHLRTWRARHITPLAIKESMDLLPEGFCFGDAAGVPVMVNLAMDIISDELLGGPLTNMEQFWQLLTERRDADAGDGDAPILRMQDGRMLRFRRRGLPPAYTEITAVDITEQYEAMTRLRTESMRLEAMKRRLIRYGEDVAATTRQQEILAAKIAVHDDMGHVLLATKHYLDEPADSDLTEIGNLWRKTIDMFRSGSAPEREPDAAATLIRAAHAVGVEAVVDGDMPAERTARNIVINALHETITNTLRHAHGDGLRLVIRETADFYSVTVTNNGVPPTAPIRETGGLRLLRQMTETAGGTMDISLSPAFSLTLTIPKGAEL